MSDVLPKPTLAKAIEDRVTYYEGELKKLKDLFNTTTVEAYDKVMNRSVQALVIEIAYDLSVAVQSKLACLRIPYQVTIVDTYLSFLRDLRSTLNTYVYSER
jgi:hypothetical protein